MTNSNRPKLNRPTARSRWSLSQTAMWTCIVMLWMVATIAVLQVGSNVISNHAMGQPNSNITTPDDGLRYTTMGWQKPAQWMPQPQQGSPINLSSVSPLIWAAMLVFAVGIAMMWLSSEDEVERMFRQRFEQADIIYRLETKNQTTTNKI